ncbi:MAG: HXXEE domain-containing protein [Chthoniobacterales bacterium]|nr:HXXEE domain-containing protein [Chthoniobacterales bacterium]
MSHTFILWIALFAYAMHATEEYILDWKGWANSVLRLPVDWTHFAVVNSAVVVLGISCAAVGWSLPEYALALPALMLINAAFFHVLPFLVTKGRFSPGLGTAVLLFFPIGLWAYRGARLDGVLTTRVLVTSFILGALLMAFPILLLKIRQLPYFNQRR